MTLWILFRSELSSIKWSCFHLIQLFLYLITNTSLIELWNSSQHYFFISSNLNQEIFSFHSFLETFCLALPYSCSTMDKLFWDSPLALCWKFLCRITFSGSWVFFFHNLCPLFCGVHPLVVSWDSPSGRLFFHLKVSLFYLHVQNVVFCDWLL